mgnify:FL=1
MKTEEYLKKIYTMLIVVLVISIMSLLIGLVNYSNTKGTTNNNSSTTTNNGSSTNNYDVSMFNEVSVSDILKFLETSNKDTHILYLGRSTCSACVAFLPNLQATQREMNFTTDYLDITKVDTSSDDFTKFSNLLSKEITQNVNGTTQTGKISEFYGLTPMIVVIKNGEAVDAIVGSYSKDNLQTFLKKYIG